MFDDLNEEATKNDIATNANPVVENNKKAEQKAPTPAVEDIFSDTEGPGKPLAFQAKDKLSNSSSEEADITKAHNTKKILLLLGIFCVFILFCVAGYFIYVTVVGGDDKPDKALVPVEDISNKHDDNSNNKPEAQTTPTKQEVEPAPKVDEPEVKKDDQKNIPKDEIPDNKKDSENIANKDSDGDGLSDLEESILGTNINNKDTDADGLSDDQEVKIYKTDPLSPDTDNDGYLDGAEIESGYNPKGAGKL